MNQLHSRIFNKKSTHETWKNRKDRACMSVSLFTFYTHERTFTRWFSFAIFRRCDQVLFAQVYSVRITQIYLLFSYQDSFVNIITPLYKIIVFYRRAYSSTRLRGLVHAFVMFRHSIGQYIFYFPRVYEQTSRFP